MFQNTQPQTKDNLTGVCKDGRGNIVPCGTAFDF